MDDGGFMDRKEKKEKPNYSNTEVKLPASALSFILECPCCGFEGPANGVARKPFPRILNDFIKLVERR
jgi:hypothetical protein